MIGGNTNMVESRQDFCDILKQILLPLKKYYSEGNALVKCGVTAATYDDSVAQMEAFARPLWGLAPFWCEDEDFEGFDDIYIKGIINGTDPESDEYWGKMSDFDQRIVETAPIGLALALCPEKIWEPLTETQKRNLYTWLWQVNEIESVDGNWQFFSVIVNLGFKKVGVEYSQERINHAISRYNAFYIGNGWYSDGKSDAIDYYVSFAIHFYSLIYAKLNETDDPINSAIFKERANLFAKDFIYWFDKDGSALAFGRSLTYRFAQCAFWSACVFAGVKPFPIDVMKGIISRNINYWINMPIFDNGGILSIGYGYPNLGMAEGYNAYGSPYWALKAFLILALNKDNEFFTTKSAPLPELEPLRIIKEAKMVIQHINGSVFALTSGQWSDFEPTHTPEKYSKFLYSSKYAFSTPKSYSRVEYAGADNMLVFVDDNDLCYVRKRCKGYEITDDGIIYSQWSPCKGVEVETRLIPTENGHIRTHQIKSEYDWCVYDCSVASVGDTGVIAGDGGEIVTINSINCNLLNANAKIKAVKYQIKQGISEIRTEIKYPYL